MEDLLGCIEQENLTFEERGATYETLLKVLRNIVANPTEPKFRTLKKDNKLVSEKLCRSSGAVSVLLALGFEDDSAVYRCPSDADLAMVEEVVQLLECIVASRVEESPTITPSMSTEAPAEQVASTSTSASVTGKATSGPSNSRAFGRRSDDEKKREEQARELEAARAAQRAQFTDGSSNSATLRAAAPSAAPTAKLEGGYPESKNKPVKTAFDFESRSKREQQEQNAAASLEEIRRQQRDKFKQFEADPNAKKAAVYQQPPSVPAGTKVDQGWGQWLGGMFGGGSGSSSSGGGGSRPDDREKPKMKTINDLPKPVQRG